MRMEMEATIRSIGGTFMEIELDKVKKPGTEAGSPLKFPVAVSKPKPKPKPSPARPPRYPKKKQQSPEDESRSAKCITGFDQGKDSKGQLGDGNTPLPENSWSRSEKRMKSMIMDSAAGLLLEVELETTLKVSNFGLRYGQTILDKEKTTRSLNEHGRSIRGTTIKEKQIKHHSASKLSLSAAERPVKHNVTLMPSGRDEDAYERMLVKDFAEPTLRDLCSEKREPCGQNIKDDVVPTKYIKGSLRRSCVEVMSPLRHFVLKKYFAKAVESNRVATELSTTTCPDGHSRVNNPKRKMLNDQAGGDVISATFGRQLGLDGEVGGVLDVDGASLKLQQLHIGGRCIT